MIKKKPMINVFRFFSFDDNDYIVTLKQLKNTNTGCPRYEAVIVEGVNHFQEKSMSNAVYTFTGHYLCEREEARWILHHHLGIKF